MRQPTRPPRPAKPALPRRRYGFTRAGVLVEPHIRQAGEQRGFVAHRLLTHWDEIVGADIARLCRPIKVGYARGGIGATLTVIARGAAGPMLQVQLPQIRERVNACYGYSAISQIRVTQTAPGGFAEPATPFGAAPHRPVPAAPEPQAEAASAGLTHGITDPELRAALQALGAQILSRSPSRS